MTCQEIKTKFHRDLSPFYPETERESFFYLLTEHFLQMTRLDLALNPDFQLDQKIQSKFEKALNQLCQEIPVQHIIGSTEFMGLKFTVNKHVLIPRPETEELVTWMLNHYSPHQAIKTLDIGTGSGCIAISLSKLMSNNRVTALDISAKTLEIAKKNARFHKTMINFKQADILSVTSLEGKFDLIVSNPPYVRMSEKKQMSNNVTNYEPPEALYVNDDDPLIFYKKIARLSRQALNEGGYLYFEINQYLGNETKSLLKKEGFSNIELKKDIYGHDRMLRARKN